MFRDTRYRKRIAHEMKGAGHVSPVTAFFCYVERETNRDRQTERQREREREREI